MIKVSIDGTEKIDNEIDERWIAQQINKRKDEGKTPCVIVEIRENGIDMILSTPNCSHSAGGSRKPTINEERILNLWEKNHLKSDSFAGGNLVAFIKQLREAL